VEPLERQSGIGPDREVIEADQAEQVMGRV